MAWLGIDPYSGHEYIFSHKPYLRKMEDIVWLDATRGQLEHLEEDNDKCMIKLPNGTIELLLGRKLTIEDGPVEIL